jgi:hypothetical protein
VRRILISDALPLYNKYIDVFLMDDVPEESAMPGAAPRSMKTGRLKPASTVVDTNACCHSRHFSEEERKAVARQVADKIIVMLKDETHQ